METNDISEVEVVKKRGFWLSAFLILMFIANLFTAFTYFSNPEMIIQAYPNMTKGILYFMGAMSIVNIILAVGVWMWKKWGVFGFYGVAVIVFCINIYVGIGIIGSLSGLIGIVIIFFTTKNRWENFA